MKTFIMAAVAVATLAGAALPASADTIIRDGRRVAVVDEHRHAPVVVVRDHRGLHRVVFYDRFHHRHVAWR